MQKVINDSCDEDEKPAAKKANVSNVSLLGKRKPIVSSGLGGLNNSFKRKK
jgi:hypothetical protein